MTASNKPILLLLLAFALTAGCSKPAGDYLFVSAEKARTQGGTYEFHLSLDSLHTYTTDLAARIVTSKVPTQEINLDVHITAPDGTTSIERLTLSLQESPGVQRIAGNGSVTDFRWPWHTSRIDGPRAGRWQVRITPTDAALSDAFYGIGLSYEGKPWEKGN